MYIEFDRSHESGWSGPGLSNAFWSTPSSLTIFFISVCHSLVSGGSGGQSPQFLALKGFGFSELGIQCFSVYCVDKSQVDQTAFNEPALNHLVVLKPTL